MYPCVCTCMCVCVRVSVHMCVCHCAMWPHSSFSYISALTRYIFIPQSPPHTHRVVFTLSTYTSHTYVRERERNLYKMHPSGAYLAHVALPALQWSTGSIDWYT